MKSNIFLTLLCIILNVINATISCLDESNNKVVSWTIFKLPQGTIYFYYDTEKESLQESLYSLNDTSNGALTNTVSQLWSESTPNYVIYNDEPPSNPPYNFSVAHSKGFWIWDDTSAIIVTHSIPKFPLGPQESEEYIGLLSNAWTYGQVLTCLTVTPDEIDAMVSYLEITDPLVYETTIPSLPSQQQQQQQKQQKQQAEIPCNTYILENTYIWFVKSPSTQVDIWSTCVAPYFASGLSVESWLHGTNPDGPTCSTEYNTVDIQTLQFGSSEISNYNDHSKWGIGELPLVCIGDLNRMESQMVRGGGVYCWKNPTLWQIMNNIIQSTDSC